MFKKTITYTDYNGTSRTEDFYFNLSKAELVLMEFSTPGGLLGYAENIQNTHDTKKLVDLFIDLVKKSYGVKSPDGRRFIKTQEALDDFVQSEAYSELIVELISNPDSASAFFNGLAESVAATSKSADLDQARLNLVK